MLLVEKLKLNYVNLNIPNTFIKVMIMKILNSDLQLTHGM